MTAVILVVLIGGWIVAAALGAVIVATVSFVSVICASFISPQ
jgi:hypothetical protein